MLDAPGPVLDAVPDRFSRVGVRGHVGARVGGTLGHGADLGPRKLEVVDLVRGAGHAAAAHDLDEIRARADLLPDRLHALRDPVADATQTGRHAAAAEIMVVWAPVVGVPPRLREGVAGEEEPGAREESVVDGLLEGEEGPAAVTDGGEAAVQHLGADVGLAEDRDVVRVPKRLGEVAEPGYGHEVDVRIDQARAEIMALAVDDGVPLLLCGLGDEGLCGRPDRVYAAVSQLDRLVGQDGAVDDVDNLGIGENVTLWRWPKPRLQVGLSDGHF